MTEHGVEVVNVGSAGAKVAELLAGRADAYVHDSGFYEWDVAAHWQLPSTMGWPPATFDGSVVTFNHQPPWVADLVVCLPGLAPFLIG